MAGEVLAWNAERRKVGILLKAQCSAIKSGYRRLRNLALGCRHDLQKVPADKDSPARDTRRIAS